MNTDYDVQRSLSLCPADVGGGYERHEGHEGYEGREGLEGREGHEGHEGHEGREGREGHEGREDRKDTRAQTEIPQEVNLRQQWLTAVASAIGSLVLVICSAGDASAQPYAYVLAERAGDNASIVTVINTATNSKVTSIPLGAICSCLNPHGVAASPDGARVYVSSTASNVVSVIDTTTNTVVANWNAGTRPSGLVVSPDGSRLFVINTTGFSTQTGVRVIQTSTGVTVGNISLGVSNATGIAITPDGSRLYVTTLTGMAGNDTVKVINVLSNSVIATIPVGNLPPGTNTPSFPVGVDVSPDGSAVYVAVRHAGINNGVSYGAVAVISPATNSVLANINVGVNPHPVRVSPDGAFVYVAHNGIPFTTSVIARSNHAVAASIPGTPHANSMAITPDGTRALITSSDGMVVSLDTNARRVAASIPFSAASEGVPEAIAIASPPAAVQPPTALSVVSVVGNSVTLQWVPPSTGPVPSHYVIEGGVSPGQVLGRVATTGPAPNLTFTAPTGAFFVRVHAALGASRSQASNEIPLLVNIAAPCAAPPQPPTNVQAVKSASVISVSWSQPASGEPPTGYQLNVTGSFTGTFNTANRALSGAAGPGTYNLSVVATNACGSSAPTAVVSVSMP